MTKSHLPKSQDHRVCTGAVNNISGMRTCRFKSGLSAGVYPPIHTLVCKELAGIPCTMFRVIVLLGNGGDQETPPSEMEANLSQVCCGSTELMSVYQ